MLEDKFILLFLGLVYLALLLFLLIPVGDDSRNKKFYIIRCIVTVGLGYCLLVDLLTGSDATALGLKNFWNFHLPAFFASLLSMSTMVLLKKTESQRRQKNELLQ